MSPNGPPLLKEPAKRQAVAQQAIIPAEIAMAETPIFEISAPTVLLSFE